MRRGQLIALTEGQRSALPLCVPLPVAFRQSRGYGQHASLARPRMVVASPLASWYTVMVSEWIYFIHPPRENFAATMTEEERAVWGVHFERFQRLLTAGTLILVGPTLGATNTGIAIFEADDEDAARRLMLDDPVVAGGYATGELRPFRVSLMRGRPQDGDTQSGT
jgi:uncharacterized protein YciI